MTTLRINIEGMSCGHCISHVREAISAVPGAVADDVRIGSAEVRLPPGVSPDALLQAIRDAGFEAEPAPGGVR
jgi:copper chaperone CopZ